MTLIKRTRLKFFFVMAGIIIIIVFAFCASIMVSTKVRNSAATDRALQKMIEDFDNNLPDFPGFPNNNGLPGIEGFNTARGFSVKITSDFKITAIKNSDSFFSIDSITEYVESIKKTGKSSGKIGDLEYLIKNTRDGKILAALDASMENASFNELLVTVFFVGGSGIIVLLILVWFLSLWIIKPTEAAFQKQKRFISEAGHELKTPLSVISASVELMQKSINDADNKKWLDVVKQQTDKMSIMTSELLTLSKIDETETVIKTEFDLSQTVLTEALAFESIAFETSKQFICEIDNGLVYRGDAMAVRQAVGILCDNAIKYSEPQGTINVRLKKQASKIILSVSNTGNTINKDEIPLLFERFYRGDDSRAETNGAGLGLAILKTSADKNGWKLDVIIEKNSVTFLIIF